MSTHFDSFYYTCKYRWLYYFDLWQTAFLLININIVWINTALLCMCIRHHFITMHMGVWTKLEILILFNHDQIWWRKVRGLQLSVYFINIAPFLSNALFFVFVFVFCFLLFFFCFFVFFIVEWNTFFMLVFSDSCLWNLARANVHFWKRKIHYCADFVLTRKDTSQWLPFWNECSHILLL